MEMISESCDLRVIENPQSGFRQNLHRPPYINILFFKEALWHRLNYRRLDYGMSTISRARAADSWPWITINLQVEEGEFVSIVGPSGCGKTTFINLCDGLLKPTAGHIAIDGVPVTGPGTDRGMVFQDSCLMPWRTVVEERDFWSGVPRSRQRRGPRSRQKFIKLVGLQGFEDHYPHELSGGMQQRCNLARALTVDPKILIMDEPFAALDAQTREIMQAELLRIWRESGKTVLFITHQINEAIYLAGSRNRVWRASWKSKRDDQNRSAAPARSFHQARSEILTIRRSALEFD